MQCPCCLTLIHSDAYFEEGAVQKGFVLGESACLWQQAQDSLDKFPPSICHADLSDRV